MTIETKLHYIKDAIQSALNQLDATEPQSGLTEERLTSVYHKLEEARDLLPTEINGVEHQGRLL